MRPRTRAARAAPQVQECQARHGAQAVHHGADPGGVQLVPPVPGETVKFDFVDRLVLSSSPAPIHLVLSSSLVLSIKFGFVDRFVGHAGGLAFAVLRLCRWRGEADREGRAHKASGSQGRTRGSGIQASGRG